MSQSRHREFLYKCIVPRDFSVSVLRLALLTHDLRSFRCATLVKTLSTAPTHGGVFCRMALVTTVRKSASFLLALAQLGQVVVLVMHPPHKQRNMPLREAVAVELHRGVDKCAIIDFHNLIRRVALSNHRLKKTCKFLSTHNSFRHHLVSDDFYEDIAMINQEVVAGLDRKNVEHVVGRLQSKRRRYVPLGVALTARLVERVDVLQSLVMTMTCKNDSHQHSPFH